MEDDYTLPPGPSVYINYDKEFQHIPVTNCVGHQVELLKSFLLGYFDFVRKIFTVSSLALDQRFLGPFEARTKADRILVMQQILSVVLCMSKPLTMRILLNTLHEIINPADSEDCKLPRETPVGGNFMNNGPCIYALVLCNSIGDTPTKSQFECVLLELKSYVEANDEKNIGPLNARAREIDTFSPHRKHRRRWNRTWHPGTTLYPRRFANSAASRQSVRDLVEQLTKRLAGVEGEDVPWSLTYIGWTSHETRRKEEHMGHIGTSPNLARSDHPDISG